MHFINTILLDELKYNLPEQRIAKYPLENRDASKLLVYKEGQIKDRFFKDISTEIPSGSLLFANNTKVIRSRLFFKRATGALIEIFCLEPHQPAEIASAMQASGSCVWQCMVGNLTKWKEDYLETQLIINNLSVGLRAYKADNYEENILVRFEWENQNVIFSDILEAIGNVPIPPYLKRESVPDDIQRYQTVYAQMQGSVAAPTAGLHFTPTIINDLALHAIHINYLTLHVGAGTFLPIKKADVREHKMHQENFIITNQLLESLINHNDLLVSVGTTSMRALESIYWMGVKQIKQAVNFNKLEQWEAYTLAQNYSAKEAYESILLYLTKNNQSRIHASTSLMILPGYRFRTAQALITNFHQPGSTLLLLVATAIGKNWEKIYQHALDNDYRFLSYGDSSLLFFQ